MVSIIMMFIHWITMFCITENASKLGNFAHKTEANAERQNEGVALP